MSDPEDNRPPKDTKRRESILEVLDELIFHLNNTKGIFTLLIISSLILAPIALILGGIFITFPRFLFFLLNRVPDVGIILLVYVVISIIFSSIWLYIGIKEQRFFSKWNNKFRRYMSLKSQIDKELGEEDENT
ncbi:MAG: putative membrane protein [Candidatus Nitrosomirales archaeon]|jgi:uncharacterized membrane protein